MDTSDSDLQIVSPASPGQGNPTDPDESRDSPAPPRYVYTALPTTPKTIRLLHLSRGSGNAQLEGRLEVADAGSPGPYDAISYAWGATERPCTMALHEGRHLPITASLHEALLRLRSPAEERRLWVDAACINQDDPDERAEQVRLMGLVYGQAERVICWLGEDDEVGSAAEAIDLIERIGRVPFHSVAHGMPSARFMGSAGLPGRRDAVWVSVVRFFDRAWFRRCWVVQEFVLGRRVSLVCGARTVDWRDLDNGVRKLSEHSLLRWGTMEVFRHAPGPVHLRGPWLYKGLRDRLPNAEAAITDFRAIASLRKESSPDEHFHDTFNRLAVGDVTLRDLDVEFSTYRNPLLGLFLGEYRTSLDIPDVRRTAQAMLHLSRNGQIQCLAPLRNRHPRFPFVTIAIHLKNRLASDPRDRLFALLGIAEGGDDPALRPSYTEPVASTYIRFARHLITNAADTATMYVVLEAGQHFQPVRPVPGLPSWVYDWSHRPALEMKSLASIGANTMCYHAAATTLPRVVRTTVPGEMRLVGGRVDSIARIVACADLLSERDEEGNQYWFLTEDGKFNIDLNDPNSLEAFLSRTKKLLATDHNLTQDLRHFFAEVDALFLDPQIPLRRARRDEGRREVLWRTLFADLGISQAKQLTLAGRRHELEYLDFRRRLASFDASYGRHTDILDFTLSPAAGHWTKMFFNLCQFYSICTTTSGWAGLVPRCAVAGDEVHVLLGADMPVVLRAVDDWSPSYRVVGACYVHGIMQGEFLQSPAWQEREICLV